MTTQKKTRRWLILLAIPVALMLIFALVVKLYFTDERLRALIVPEIESATHRSAGIGSVSLSLFPDIGITIDDFSLSNRAGTEYPHPSLVSLRRLFIDVKLLPLFSRRLEVNRLVVEEPVVHLDVTDDGMKNYSGGGGARAVAGEGTGADGGGAFLLANMEIRNGRIESHNRKLDTRWTVSGLNQTLRMESSGGANAIVIEGTSLIDSFSYGTGSSWLIRDLPVTAELKLSYRPDDDWLDLRDVRLRIREVPLTINGSVRNLRQETLLLDLSVDSPELSLGHLLSLLPADESAGEVTAEGNVRFSMKILGESGDDINPSVSAVFSVSDGTAKYSSLRGSITDISMEGSLELPQAAVGRDDIGDARLDRFTARMGGNELNGKLRVTGFGDPEIDASLRGDIALGEVGDYYPLPAGTVLTGRVNSDITLSGKPRDPREMKASGTMVMRDVGVSSPGLARPLRNLNGEMKFNNRLLEIKNASLFVGESDLGLDASVDNYLGLVMQEEAPPGAAPLLNFSLRSRKLRTADLAGSGHDTAAVARSKDPKTPSGAGLLPGGIDMAGTVAIDTLVTEKFTFTGAHGTLSASGGVLKLQQLRLDAFDGTITTSGTLDLRDAAARPFDLKLNADGVESHSFLSPVTTFGKYLFGKLSLSTEMKGVLDDTLGILSTDLTGNGNALISGGKLTGVPLLQSLSGFLSADNLREVDFKSWTQSFSIADGKVKIDDLKIGGGDADITVNGFHGLDGTMDYSLRVRLPERVSAQILPSGIAGQLLQFFRDRDGGMSFDFLVSGGMAAPVLKLDTRAQEELLRQKLKDDALKKLGDPLKKAAEGLKKLIKP